MTMTLTDWESCTTIFMNVLVGVATIAGAIIAGLGLKTWRYELRGHANFDLARRVMLCVYQFRNEFRSARNIGSPEHIESHYGRLNDKGGELDLALVEAEILWGNLLQSAKQKVKECKNEWDFSLKKRYLHQKEKLPLSDQEREKIDAIIWGGRGDEFGGLIEDAVREFEATLRPHLIAAHRVAS